MASTFLNYLPRESFVHRLTGTTKLVIFLLFSFASIITFDTRVLLGLLVISLVAFKISRIKLKECSFMIGFLAVFLIMNALFIFLFDPEHGPTLYNSRTVLFHIAGKYDMTLEQLFYQLNIALKYFIALPIAILFISTTNPSEFASSLNSLGVPYTAAYSVSLALRYIPDVQRDFHDISQAQQARGVELGKDSSFIKRLTNSVSILLPLILTSLNRIEIISNSMQLRCFGKKKKRTWYMQRRINKNDIAVIIGGVILFALSIYITFSNGSRFYNPFH